MTAVLVGWPVLSVLTAAVFCAYATHLKRGHR